MPERLVNAAALGRTELFSGVDQDTLAAIAAELPVLNLRSGRTVFTEGEPGHLLYILLEGKVKLGSRTPRGRDNLWAIMGPSDIFGEDTIFDPGPRTCTATTLTDVAMVSVDRNNVRAWIAQRPDTAEQLLRVLARRQRRTNDNLAEVGLTDVTGRVAKQLVLLAQRFGVPENGALRVDHDLTQEEIGQLVGATRTTVNKVLSGFVQRGWILTDQKSVLILDSDRLSERARTEGCAHAASFPPCSIDPSPPAAARDQTRVDRASALHQRRMAYLMRPARI